MSGKLRLKLIVHCFQFAAEAKRRHLSPCCFSSDDYSDDYQMIYPIYYPVLLSDHTGRRFCRCSSHMRSLSPMGHSALLVHSSSSGLHSPHNDAAKIIFFLITAKLFFKKLMASFKKRRRFEKNVEEDFRVPHPLL